MAVRMAQPDIPDATRGPYRAAAVVDFPDPWRPIPDLPPTVACPHCDERLVLVHTATIFGVPNYAHASDDLRLYPKGPDR